MQIAFIGTGRMGAGMVRNLLRGGHEVTVYNRTPEKAQALVKDGARVASSIAEACRDADVCWTMLPDDAALHEVAAARAGLFEGMPPTAVHLSSSTVTVALSRKLAEEHAARRQRYLAVPVFGRPDAAEAKRLIVVAGGDAGLIETYRPLMEAIGRAVFVAGPEPWQANLFKLCGNFTLITMVEMLSEAFAAIRKSGADHRKFAEVVNELYGSPVYKNYASTILDEKFDPALFELRLAAKDIRIVLEAAGELECPMPLASVARDQLVSALAAGQGRLDAPSVSRIAARNAGLT